MGRRADGCRARLAERNKPAAAAILLSLQAASGSADSSRYQPQNYTLYMWRPFSLLPFTRAAPCIAADVDIRYLSATTNRRYRLIISSDAPVVVCNLP